MHGHQLRCRSPGDVTYVKTSYFIGVCFTIGWLVTPLIREEHGRVIVGWRQDVITAARLGCRERALLTAAKTYGDVIKITKIPRHNSA